MISEAIEISFFNEYQNQFFFNKTRNRCFSGGFGNGKTFSGCQRAVVLLFTYPNYRYAIVRKSYADLKRTTMQTFFKLIPGGTNSGLISRHSDIEGITDFINGSRIYWLHSDKFDEGTLRGLEINSVLIDQAEEIEEGIYLILDSRIGRWDKAEVPSVMITEDWPVHPITKRKLVPNYMDILANPEHTLHWIYLRYHPDSDQRQPDHFYISAPTDPNSYDPQTYAQMLKRDPEWVAKYVRGEWGTSDAQIHNITPDSIIIDPSPSFIHEIISKGALYRVLDHGDAAPTCCVWYAAYRGLYFAYREYYLPHEVISNHRRNISDLSRNEYYMGSYADPAIFKMASQKSGGFWSVSDEYIDRSLNSPTIAWMPADNNEFANRNRINELLAKDPTVSHPIYGTKNSPRLYFIKRSESYTDGVDKLISQTKSQRRESLGTFNGKTIFSDDRAKSVEDHAYDTLRYFVSIHGSRDGITPKRPIPKNSFLGVKNSYKRMLKIRAARGLLN